MPRESSLSCACSRIYACSSVMLDGFTWPTFELRCLFTASTIASSVCRAGILLWFIRPVSVCVGVYGWMPYRASTYNVVYVCVRSCYECDLG